MSAEAAPAVDAGAAANSVVADNPANGSVSQPTEATTSTSANAGDGKPTETSNGSVPKALQGLSDSDIDRKITGQSSFAVIVLRS